MDWFDGDRSLPEKVVEHFVGLDLGQAADPSALVHLERTSFPRKRLPTQYAVRFLKRWYLGTTYPDIVKDVNELIAAAPMGRPLLPGAWLIVDGTGVGRAVVDWFKRVPELMGRIAPILITAGQAVSFVDGYYHVAKIQLVSVLQTLMQSGRLKVAKGLDEADVLIRELATFKVKVTAAGNETFESWRERDHDDLVLGLAVAAWYAEQFPFTVSSYPVCLTPGKDGSGEGPMHPKEGGMGALGYGFGEGPMW